jgi:RNA polymerase sigma factor (sigma-70 family)
MTLRSHPTQGDAVGEPDASRAPSFDELRPHLHAVAYRMLGSATEADDAVQETWCRYHRAGTSEVDNLPGWLTTVVTRVCLNVLRARRTRSEEPLHEVAIDALRQGSDPEHEAVLADSVGVALLVVLDTLSPPERVAFVLHDLFGVPFVEVAHVLRRSPAAARQLASRARRRVRGTSTPGEVDLTQQRRVVDAFLAASRAGDLEALLSLLDPDIVLVADPATPDHPPTRIVGASAVAEGALLASGRARFTEPALVDGRVGLVMAQDGRLALVLAFTCSDDAITRIEVISDPERLHRLELAVLGR